MEVIYCSSCGKRIPLEELERGEVVRSGADSFCAGCVSEGAAPADAQASATEQKGRRPASRRAPRARPGSMTAASVAVLLGAVAAAGAAAFIFGLRRRRRAADREHFGRPPPTIVQPPAPERHRSGVVPGARVEPPPVEERKWVPRPPPTPAPPSDVPVAARPDVPPDPPAPFVSKEGEKILYSWDWRRWLPGMEGKRKIVCLGLNLLHTDYNCGTGWKPKGNFVVPERGIIRTRFFVTERMDVHLLVSVEGSGNQRHTWVRVEPGKWFEGVVAMDGMRPWRPTNEPITLPAGKKAHQIVLHIDERVPGVSRLYVSEIQVFAVE